MYWLETTDVHPPPVQADSGTHRQCPVSLISAAPSFTHKQHLLSWVHVGAAQAQLPPSHRASYKYSSCFWTEPGLSPRLGSVETKAAVTQPPPIVPSVCGALTSSILSLAGTLLGHNWSAKH